MRAESGKELKGFTINELAVCGALLLGTSGGLALALFYRPPEQHTIQYQAPRYSPYPKELDQLTPADIKRIDEQIEKSHIRLITLGEPE
jgi:hypothetical protein